MKGVWHMHAARSRCTSLRTPRVARGLALVESILAIAVIATAAAVILGQISLAETQSARQLQRAEATAIAAAYLDEIAARPFTDPDGRSGEARRAEFDDVDDYAGLTDAGARSADGAAIPGLERYTVRVQIERSRALRGVRATDTRRVTVTVAAPDGELTRATQYRTRT